MYNVKPQKNKHLANQQGEKGKKKILKENMLITNKELQNNTLNIKGYEKENI
jgi:hypothetical protein